MMWHRHKWTRWVGVRLTQTIDGRNPVRVNAQTRHCQTCGLETVRTI